MYKFRTTLSASPVPTSLTQNANRLINVDNVKGSRQDQQMTVKLLVIRHKSSKSPSTPCPPPSSPPRWRGVKPHRQPPPCRTSSTLGPGSLLQDASLPKEFWRPRPSATFRLPLTRA